MKITYIPFEMAVRLRPAAILIRMDIRDFSIARSVEKKYQIRHQNELRNAVIGRSRNGMCP